MCADKKLEQIRTTVTDLLKINHPIMLAGMNVAAGPKLAAAVTNAGGIGVLGGIGYTPGKSCLNSSIILLMTPV
jgi:NAD(P)H-dependent flavin oxidoreductase YrpB (nitropropane dioxygenase family)